MEGLAAPHGSVDVCLMEGGRPADAAAGAAEELAALAGAAAAEDDAPAPTSPRMSMNPVASAGDAPASPADSTPLPAGWKAATDKKSGRTYYVNRVTRKTSWRRPTE